MTEQEVLSLQAENGDQVFYLMQRGRFFHAYGSGAFALARATGFRVLRKHRKQGDVLTAGFPVTSLPRVRQLLADVGASVEDRSSTLIEFSGIDGTADETLVSEARMSDLGAVAADGGSGEGCDDLSRRIIDELLHFNLSHATPIEAMMFVSRLQQTVIQECG